MRKFGSGPLALICLLMVAAIGFCQEMPGDPGGPGGPPPGGGGGGTQPPGGNTGGGTGTFYSMVTVYDWEDFNAQVYNTQDFLGTARSFTVYRAKLQPCPPQIDTWIAKYRTATEAKATYDYYFDKLSRMRKFIPSDTGLPPTELVYNTAPCEYPSYSWNVYHETTSGLKTVSKLKAPILAAVAQSYQIQSAYHAKLVEAEAVAYNSPAAPALRDQIFAFYVQASECNNRLAWLERQWRLRTVGIVTRQAVVPHGWINNLDYIAGTYPARAFPLQMVYASALSQGWIVTSQTPFSLFDPGTWNFWSDVTSDVIPDPLPTDEND